MTPQWNWNFHLKTILNPTATLNKITISLASALWRSNRGKRACWRLHVHKNDCWSCQRPAVARFVAVLRRAIFRSECFSLTILCAPQTLVGVEFIGDVVDNATVAIVCVPRQVLVEQWRRVLHANQNRPVFAACGGAEPTKEDWLEWTSQGGVVVCTTEIVVNSIDRSELQWSDIDTLVCDEAHNALLGMKPLAKLADRLRNGGAAAADVRVLALTATPFGSKLSRISEETVRTHVKHLSARFGANCGVVFGDQTAAQQCRVELLRATNDADVLVTATEQVRHALRHSHARVVFFVQQREDAAALPALLDEIVPECRATHVLGQTFKYGNAHEMKANMAAFCRGEKNVLLATSVAGEGVDVPAVSLVVLSYVPQNLLDFTQLIGRLRARKQGRVVIVCRSLDVDRALQRREQAQTLFGILQNMAQNDDAAYEYSGADCDDIDELVMELPTTGARLMLSQAVSLLYRAVQTFYSANSADNLPQLTFERELDERWRVDLRLPPGMSLATLDVQAHGRNKSEAKARAAAAAVQQLIEARLITPHLRPISSVARDLPDVVRVVEPVEHVVDAHVLQAGQIVGAKTFDGDVALGCLVAAHASDVDESIRVWHCALVDALFGKHVPWPDGVASISADSDESRQLWFVPLRKTDNDDWIVDEACVTLALTQQQVLTVTYGRQGRLFETDVDGHSLRACDAFPNDDVANTYAQYFQRYSVQLSDADAMLPVVPLGKGRDRAQHVPATCAQWLALDAAHARLGRDALLSVVAAAAHEHVVGVMSARWTAMWSTPPPSRALLAEALATRAAKLGVDYERLEFLGDAVLQLAVTTHLFVAHPQFPEGVLSQLKSTLVSNERLAALAEHVLGVRALLASGSNEPVRGNSKILADVVEALLGAAFVDEFGESARCSGRDAGEQCSGINSEDDRASWPPTLLIALLQQWQAINIVGGLNGRSFAVSLPTHHLPSLTTLQRALSHQFVDVQLLHNALTFGAYERLELLGDAVIGLAVKQALFASSTRHSPGDMTTLARVCVRTESLAVLAVRLGLHRLLQSRPSSLVDRIADAVADIEAEECLDRLLLDVHVWYAPQRERVIKLLADLFEAVVGAIFVDLRFDVSQTLHLLQTHLLRGLIERAIVAGVRCPLDIALTLHKRWRGAVLVCDDEIHVEACDALFLSVPIDAARDAAEQCRSAAQFVCQHLQKVKSRRELNT